MPTYDDSNNKKVYSSKKYIDIKSFLSKKKIEIKTFCNIMIL